MRTLNLRVKSIVPVMAALAITAGLATPATAATATFSSISKNTTDATPSATNVSDTYTIAGQTTGTAIACITVQYAAQADGGGAIPNNTTAATLDTAASTFMASWTGWAINPATNGLVKITRASGSAAPASGSVSLKLGGITNGATPNQTYYAIVKTYTVNDCTTGPQDNGLVGYVYTPATQVSVTVDPSMTFTVGNKASSCSQQPAVGGAYGYTAPTDPAVLSLGRINSSTVGQAANTLLVQTNANGGAVVFVKGDYAGTSGNYNMRTTGGLQLADTGGVLPAANNERFSYTNSETAYSPSAWKGLTNGPTAIAAFAKGETTGSEDCIGFSASVASSTAAGVYTAKVYYTAVPTF